MFVCSNQDVFLNELIALHFFVIFQIQARLCLSDLQEQIGPSGRCPRRGSTRDGAQQQSEFERALNNGKKVEIEAITRTKENILIATAHLPKNNTVTGRNLKSQLGKQCCITLLSSIWCSQKLLTREDGVCTSRKTERL